MFSNGHSNGSVGWSDLITDFMSLTEGAVSPHLFRLWSGISLVAGALERRVWAQVGDFLTYPNLYVVLVAPPGVGKQIIEVTQDLWTSTVEPGTTTSPAFHPAPDSVTKASLLDVLSESKRSFLPSKGPLVVYHSLLVAAEEFGVLLPDYDQEFIANLNKIFNNPLNYRERRRTSVVKKLDIDMPQLNILAGATPSYFVGTFPEEAWSTGFARRIIMVYSSETPFKELFEESPGRATHRANLLDRLSYLAGLYGQILWREEAAARLAEWHRAGNGKGGPPVPTHSKLEHYSRSRTMHAIKLAMVSAVSRTGELVIDLLDVDRAIGWLVEAEALMPDIFRAMTGKSDVQILEELHYFVQQQWMRNRQKAVTGESIRRFLSARIPHDKIESLIGVAHRANIVARVEGADLWLPRPKHERGAE